MIQGYDPCTGKPAGEPVAETTDSAVDAIAEAAAAARPGWEAMGPAGRAAALRAVAGALDAQAAELAAVADTETALGSARLTGEVARTTGQLRMFADVLEDGGYLDVIISPPAQGVPGLRRMVRPVGPVAVFSASNFPFAFSVAGGDTASALAAGCAVVVKGHEAHPRTSQLCADALRRGAETANISADVVSLVLGRDAGTALVLDPNIRAVGFTGSLSGGRALHDLASSRPSPIPFYGELGALNPLVICPSAAKNRSAEIATGLANSFTLGVGQFCTKPGLAFIPAANHQLVAELTEAVNAKSASVLLNARVQQGFAGGTTALLRLPGVAQLAAAQPPATNDGWWGTPLLLEADAAALAGAVLDECFGPVLVIVRYESDNELFDLLKKVGPALTASIHADEDDLPLARRLVETFAARVGRVVWNGFPTGVAVAWAMHHGGPYPATTDALHTSVGASSIRRWLRPVAYQDVPQQLLPAELVDAPVAGQRLPRRVDGHLEN